VTHSFDDKGRQIASTEDDGVDTINVSTTTTWDCAE
jgi:hypothetical protein